MPEKALILLVEDSALLQRVAMAQLKLLENIEVHLATNASEALTLVQHHAYSLILMDLHLPEMDGWEATRRIRLLPGYAEVPIVAVSADPRHDRSMAAGMNGHAMKPAKYASLVGQWLGADSIELTRRVG